MEVIFFLIGFVLGGLFGIMVLALAIYAKIKDDNYDSINRE